MKSVKSRLERLEQKQRFQQWLETERFLAQLTNDELRIYAETGKLPESILCMPIGHHPSRLDEAQP